MANQFFLVSLLTMALFFTSLLHVESRNGEFLFVSLDRSNHMVKTHDKSSPLETPTPAPAPAPVSGGENNNIDEFAPVPAAPESGNVFAPSPIESGNGFFGPAPAPSRGDDIEIAPTPSVSGIGNEFPVPVPAPAPESFESDNPYGLYGQEEEDNKELNNEKLHATEYNNNNGYGNKNYNRNANDDNADGYLNRAYNSMGYSNRAYNSMGYSNEKQGMSDTRFLDNGKYYYDPSQGNYNNQNDGGRYESVRESSNEEEGYYGKLSQSDLNSMEEYERQNGYSP